AIAASDIAVDALFHQAGVIRADTIDEMFDIATCLEAQPLPPGRRVAIVTNAGGPGLLAVDACEAAGLTVAPFSDATRARLAEFLPPEAGVRNPIDTVASAGPAAYRRAIETTLTAEGAAGGARVAGWPSAAKLGSRRVPPRAEGGAVQLIRVSEGAGRRAFADVLARGRTLVPEAEIDGVLIQSMVTGGVETRI